MNSGFAAKTKRERRLLDYWVSKICFANEQERRLVDFADFEILLRKRKGTQITGLPDFADFKRFAAQTKIEHR
jgi:hypothetical protein